MSVTRQRSDRGRHWRFSEPEILEVRQVLSGIPAYQSPWIPSDQLVTNPITHQRELYNGASEINQFNPNSPGLSNEGKVVSGIDRAGDKWIITVHGPGKVIVTDTTPNDGVLDDDINTIQLVNTNIRTTYVTANVIPSNIEPTDGIILFNQLIDLSGVKSIELNGFDLSSAVTPTVTTPTGIFLFGGVGVLSFNGVDATIDTSVNPSPYQIEIGEASTPLKVQPSIYINNITNLVFDSASSTIPTTPLTTPTVQIRRQRRDQELRHRVCDRRNDSRRLPGRVPGCGHDRAYSRPGDGDRQTQGGRLGAGTSRSRGRRCPSRRMRAGWPICTRPPSAAMPMPSASTSTARSASSRSSAVWATLPASTRQRLRAASCCQARPTGRPPARPDTRPPASPAAQSAPRRSASSPSRPANTLVQTAQNPLYVQLQEWG